MIANDIETWIRLSPGMLFLVISLYYFVTEKRGGALGFLLLGAFLLRLAMISLEPLNVWDERFHALVAKNMLAFPFKPMLHITPVIPFDYQDWTGNHVWLHKQPLFLWQMALSMKIFGVNEYALRLPSAIMGSIMVFFIYQIMYIWTKKQQIAYIAAFFFALSFFNLELTSGRIGMDHNDICFTFYVTASIWAFCKFTEGDEAKWIVLIGLFVGLAVLVKWLAGILVFGGWGLYILLDSNKRTDWKSYLELILAALISLAIFMPWQIYISNAFPLESSWEYGLNTKHFLEVIEGHSGGPFFHLQNMGYIYFFPFGVVLIGIIIVLWKYRSKLTFSMLSMFLVVYLFFSVAATKVQTFPYIVTSILFGIVAIALYESFQFLFRFVQTTKAKRILLFAVLILLGYLVMNPPNMANNRSEDNHGRNNRIHNLDIYKNLPEEHRVIFNVKSFEDVDLMFYHGGDTYDFCPSEQLIDSLLNAGLKLSAFKSHGDKQLPSYMLDRDEIMILDYELW